MTTRISLWSGPRNVSTALMYAFRSRADTTVVDEPLIGHYLDTTGLDQPHRDEVLATYDLDGARVVAEQLLGPVATPVVMFKNMAHHLVDLDLGFLDQLHNVVLVRDPRQVLPSLVEGIPDPALSETGLPLQVEVVERELAVGRAPIVVETATLLQDPERVLRDVCRRCGLDWDPAMLSWDPGPTPEDGPWAPFWYRSVWRSTGFRPPSTTTRELPDGMGDLLDEAVALHDRLMAHAIA